MKKNQQFYVMKFNSKRLKKANFKVEITLDEARKNSELISVNNSELLRTIFRCKNVEYSQKELDELLINRKKLKRLKNNENNLFKIKNITEKIESILFVESLISVEFDNKKHYLEIVNRKGFYINGTRYVPFMASAGMIRQNRALFIDNNLRHPIRDVLDCGRNEKTPMVSAKFGAYFSLYSSSTLPVSFPKFAVIPDKEIVTIRRVDFVEYVGLNEDDKVTEMDYPIKSNAWDGQGLISPRLARQWSDELELDYVFSSAIIRAPFLKGLVAVFDIHKFSSEIAGTRFFTDIYGDEQNINDVDLIINESMFKLWNSYTNTESYINACAENHLGFSVAKVNSKKEKSHSRTSYQFLQVLKLNEIDVANLCESSVNWFRNISGKSAEEMLLYITGENNFEPKDFYKLDVTSKAILLNPALSRDRYIQDKFTKTIEKKKKESYMGSLLINANYQFMISDPYHQACHIFGLDKEPLLKDGQHYSEYWLNKSISRVGAIRSPIVHHSEFNILNFKDNKDTRKWFEHIHSGIIFPTNGVGIDSVIHGGSDSDGDLICTINNQIMIKGKVEGLPIVYESRKSDKVIVDSRDDKSQVEGQLKGHNSKVGFATNISSSLYTLLEEFPVGSKENETILRRLKIGRAIQGEIIDSVKGLDVPPFRNHWTKYTRIKDDMTPEEKEKWEFNNRVLCEVRPSFFRFLYQKYMTKYNKELKIYNTYSHMAFKKDFSEISGNKDRSPEEQSVLDDYRWNSFFLDNNSVVNRISRYMRGTIGLVGRYSNASSKDFDYKVLLSKPFMVDSSKLHKMESLLSEYRSFKRGLWRDSENSFENMDAFINYLKKKAVEISTNEGEIASYAVLCTYQGNVGQCDFPWRVFSEGLLQNIQANSNNKIYIPVADPEGDIIYLWNRYSIKEVSLEDLYGRL